MFKKSLFFLLVLFVSAGVLSSCAKNPVTHREEFVLMSEEQELELGRKSAPVFLRQFGGVYQDEKLQAYVSRLGQALAESSDRPELFYHFYVVDSPIVNAFALPGGYIFVTRGTVEACNSEAQLAGVLAHEVGHVNARHAVQQYTEAQVINMIGVVAQVMLGGAGSRLAGDARRLISIGVLRGFGREKEYEADALSIDYLHRSNYNPYGTRDFLTTLNISEEGKTNGFEGLFASHPDTLKRIRRAEELADKTGYENTHAVQKEMQDIYYKMIDGMVYGKSVKEGFFLGPQFVHKDLGISVRFPEGWHYYNERNKVVAMDRKKKEEQVKENAKKKIQNFKVQRPRRICELKMEQLKKRYPLSKIIDDKFSRANVKRLDEWEEDVDGNHFYVVVYKGNYTGVRRKMIMRAYVQHGETLYSLISIAPKEVLLKEMDTFKAFYRSFHFLSDKEREELQPPHIKIITVKEGDTFRSLALTYAHDEEMAEAFAKLNGIRPGSEPVVGQKLKVVVQ